jgi:hypothetical protein
MSIKIDMNNLNEIEEQTNRIVDNLSTIKDAPVLDNFEEQTSHIACNLSIIQSASDFEDGYEERLDRIIEKLERIKALREETGE